MSRARASRPTLLPALRRLWRDPHRLQLGTDPGRAVLLELPDPRCARLLDLLDGTRTEAGLVREAARAGIPPERTNDLLRLLRQRGLVLDAQALAPTGLSDQARRRLTGEVSALALRANAVDDPPAVRLRRRQAAHVLITGASQLAVPIATVLGAAGVGHLDPDVDGVTRIGDTGPAGLLPADAHRPRGVAAVEAIRRAAPEANVSRLRPHRATFAVLVGHTGPPALTALSLGNRGLAHLAVTVRDGVVVVGPLVRPGVTPCLNCLDLHRRDRDPDWPKVCAQLNTGPHGTRTDGAEPLAVTTGLAGVAYAAQEVLSHIDGGVPTTLGTTVEISAPGQDRRRRWHHHPRCGCLRHGRGRHTRPPAARG